MLFYAFLAFILVLYIIYPKSKWEAAVFLYVAFISLRRLLNPEDQLLGMLDQNFIVSTLLIITGFNYKVPGLKKYVLDRRKLNVIYLAIFSLIILARYFDLKSGLINGEIDLFTQIKRLIRDTIYIYALVLVIKRMHLPETYKGLENGLIFSVILIVLSIIFYDTLESIGFYSLGEREMESLNRDNFARLTGFRGGNPNGAAATFNLVLAYALGKVTTTGKFTNKLKILVAFLFVGIFLFASKTGLLVASVLILYFLFKNRKNIKLGVVSIIVIALLVLVTYSYFGDIMEYRIEQQITGEFDSAASRFYHWNAYLKYFSDIPKNFEMYFFGYIDPISHGGDVHNTFMGLLYDTGLFSLIIVLTMLWKIYSSSSKSSYYSFDVVFLFLALVLHWMAGSTYLNYWFFLIAAASSGSPVFLFQQKNLASLNKT